MTRAPANATELLSVTLEDGLHNLAKEIGGKT
jgi:hypothetical protein